MLHKTKNIRNMEQTFQPTQFTGCTHISGQICGGNIYGIFVESLDDDSPAKSPDGLLPGDLILEVCRCALFFYIV